MAFKNKKMMSFGLEPEYYELLQKQSGLEHTSIADIIREAIKFYFDSVSCIDDDKKLSKILEEIQSVREELALLIGGM